MVYLGNGGLSLNTRNAVLLGDHPPYSGLLKDMADRYELREQYWYPSLYNSARKLMTSFIGPVVGSMPHC